MIFCAWLAYILAYTVDYVHLPSVIRRRAQDKRTEAKVGGDQIHVDKVGRDVSHGSHGVGAHIHCVYCTYPMFILCCNWRTRSLQMMLMMIKIRES